ncbi:MAG: hypothetical protein D6741_08590 [Planctomycetota bacterium]|nr:MAG: hypothetical protein D6741_08590 [Planctomycetota bacterium]
MDLLLAGCFFTGAAVALAAYSLRDRIVAVFEAVEEDIGEKLRRLRAPTRHLRRNLILWLVGIVACFLAFWLLLNSLIFAFLLSAFLIAAPWYLLRRMAERYRQKIEDQLADAMVALSNAVRAGLSLTQALEILAAQCPKPINGEFRQIVGQYNMGQPLAQTLTEAKQRLKSENFSLFAAALLASHEHGGKLNETVERIAQSVLELQRLDRKIMAETAQARKSSIYMAISPWLILVAYYYIDPENTKMLFTQPLGHLLLAMAVVLNVIAYLWARAILNPDI